MVLRGGDSIKNRLKGLFDGRADLGNDSPAWALLKLAIPSIGLFVFNSLLHLVDTIYVSWLGEFPMAAMSFTGPVNQCVFAMLECVAAGSAALMGRNLGRNNVSAAQQIARSALALLYVFCLVAMPLLLPSVSNVIFSGIGTREAGGDSLLRLCYLYNMWVPIMMPWMGYTYVINTTFRAQGDTLTPFKAIGMANLLNIVLDPLFIFTFGWGISGAAIATWVSRIFASFYLFYRMKAKSALFVPPWLNTREPLRQYWKNILWIGVPVALTTASVALGMGSVNKILSTFGHRAVASWMLGLRVEELAYNLVAGVVSALVPFIAFNYGKRDIGRMLSGFKAAYGIAVVLMCSMGVVIYCYPGIFLSLFKPLPEIETMSARAIRASVPSYPFGALVSLSCAFFTGTGYSIYGTLTQLLRSIVFRISAAWVFATYLDFAYIWYFQSFAAFNGSFVAFFLFVYVYRKIKRNFALENANLNLSEGAGAGC